MNGRMLDLTLKHRYLADKLIMALAINKTLHQKNTF